LNLLVRHPLTAQEHHFHLQLHKWMRVVKAPIAQRFYSFRATLQLEHWRTSWSKLIWQLNFYQRFSKVSSCPARSITTDTIDGWVGFAVRDNGCGIPKAFMEHSLFRPFQTTKSQGLGIGLFHSKIIVEGHHG